MLALGLAGCGDPYKGRVAVNGTVRLKGQPLNDAFLSFTPLEGQDTQAQVLVNDGKFRIARETGLLPGKYLIRVSAGDAKTPYKSDGPPGPGGGNIVSKELVPADWNIDSKQERTVTKEGPNNFDFDIP
jgi:hypothetical protein